MNALLLTSPEQTSFSEALRYGRAYVDTLNAYQQARLADFAQQQLEGAHRTALALLQRNSGYSYPAGCEGAERGNYWLEQVTAYRPAVTVLALLAAPVPTATAAATVTDEWEALLLNNFTVTDLDKLLVEIGLLNNATEKQIELGIKPAHWKGLCEGLVNRKRLRNNKAGFHRVLTKRYGSIGSEKSLQGTYDDKNANAHEVAESIKARLSNI